jgi:hypothetical protein
MNGISEQEKRQILAAWSAPKPKAPIPASPNLPMEEFFQHVEQFARLLPPKPRGFAQGTSWKL